ncbi:O-antigen ligase family protein [Sphingomonas paeninsulae]|uniref:O-antigen ligase family protein n=1 Tax=Sphingomonas paeninsulae TaxID=2319844 RepID=A0A494TGM5_SPHPE|nr:O-antigen ligase family protein [Sphingomonas paeninsulae]AYJ86452.1 O-antigen ligase family protein [Sphingomonas paeninsulae]
MSRGAFPDGRMASRAPRFERYLDVVPTFRLSPEALASIAIMALSLTILIGTLGALVFILSTLALAAYDPARSLQNIARYSPFLILPILAVLSTFWSTSPAATMRGSLELFITVVAMILMVCNMRASRMILCVFIAHFIICLIILPSVPHSLSSGNALYVGWLGSKNQVGSCGVMLAAMAMPVMIDKTQPFLARLSTLIALPMSLLIIYLAQSGGSITSMVLMLVVFPPLAALTLIKFPLRVGLVIFTLGMLAVCSFFIDDITNAIVNFRVNVLNKDATLTGRTYLWDFAARLSANHPYLGTGFNAFWQQGNIEAEGLWRWGGIANRSGFNFHNAFVGMRVYLGLVGLILLILTCVCVTLAGLFRQLWKPSIPIAGLLSMLAVNYAKSFVEEGLLNAFSLITVLWLATGVYAFRPAADSKNNNEPVSFGRGVNRKRVSEKFGAREAAHLRSGDRPFRMVE